MTQHVFIAFYFRGMRITSSSILKQSAKSSQSIKILYLQSYKFCIKKQDFKRLAGDINSELHASPFFSLFLNLCF